MLSILSSVPPVWPRPRPETIGTNPPQAATIGADATPNTFTIDVKPVSDSPAGSNDQATTNEDQPVLIDFRVDPDEMVFPMVPSGASNDEVLESAEEWFARMPNEA